MRKTEIDWPRVARAFQVGIVPVSEIARKHGVSASTIYARARREGWQRNPGALAGKHRRVVRAGSRGTAEALARMLGIVDRLADALEEQLDDRGDAPPPDRKAAADMLTNLARALEKLTALEKTILTQNRQTPDQPGERVAAHDAWKEIQRRLARLAAAETADEDSERASSEPD